MTVRQNNREKWIVDIDFVHADGRAERIRKTSPVQTRRAAEAYERQIRQSLLDGSHGKDMQTTQVPTLADYQHEFIDWCRTERQKGTGIETKVSALRAHLVPLFGDRRLDSFHQGDQKALRKRFEGKAASTYNNSATTLNSLLTTALKESRIKAVPHHFALYRRADKARAFYDFDEFEWIVEAASKISTTALIIVLLMGEHGLRRSEVWPLTWELCDLRRGLLHIDWAETLAKDEQTGKVVRILDDTKGIERRVVPMTSRLVAALKRHRHLRERVLCGDNGEPFTDKTFKRLIQQVQRRAQLVPTGESHIFRHTYCSHLAMTGAAAKAIQELAGHKDMGTTLKYMHLAAGETRRAQDLLENRTALLSRSGNRRAPSGNLTATDGANVTIQHQTS